MEDVGIPQPNRRQPSDIFEHAYDITNWPMVRRWPTTSRASCKFAWRREASRYIQRRRRPGVGKRVEHTGGIMAEAQSELAGAVPNPSGGEQQKSKRRSPLA